MLVMAAVVRRNNCDDGGGDGDGGILLFGPLTILWAWVPWHERPLDTVQVSPLHDLIVLYPFHADQARSYEQIVVIERLGDGGASLLRSQHKREDRVLPLL